MAKLPKKYKGNFMSDARKALHGVGMVVCNKNGQSAYPDKGNECLTYKTILYKGILMLFIYKMYLFFILVLYDRLQ